MIRTRLSGRIRAISGPALSLALISQGLMFTVTQPVAAQKRMTQSVARFTQAQDPKEPARVQSERVTANAVSVVDFKSLAAAEKKKAPKSRGIGPEIRRAMPAPQTIQEVDTSSVSTPSGVDTPAAPQPRAAFDEGGPLVPSPAPSQSFLAHPDGPEIGTSIFTIPPDTMGAVGRTKIMTTLNNNWVVQNKTTGAQLSGVSMETFWGGTTATGSFDPRVQYDPYNDRWIVAGVSNAQSTGSSILIGLSDTSDPEGTFTLFRFEADDFTSGGNVVDNEWVDFPMLGFNKNWVAVGVNTFLNSNNSFTNGRVLVLDYPSLRSGVFSGTYFSGIDAANAGFCIHPATTYSATENTLYAPSHQSSSGANYRLHSITGTPAAPVFNIGALQTRPGGGWTQPGGDILPQTCIGTCPGSTRGIDSGDAFIRSNVVFRNGFIWYAQTIALPGGAPLTINSRVAAQWTKLDTTGVFADGGRVEDPTATRNNGGQHYAYPSIAVNKNNDALMGFSNFESDDLADAGYTFRLGTDAAGTMRDPVIFKEGEDYYSKDFGGTRNRWGDYSHSVVDPVNDRDLWTIQEYAQPRTAQNNQQTTNNSRWGTWWAKVSAPAGAGDLIISEFRNRGPNGVADEYVEVYNNSGSALTVQTVDGSAGYSIVAQDNLVRCTISNGTVIPDRGHFLCVNSQGYSLGNYPAGSGTATGDATFTTDIPDNNGIALFRSSTTFDATTVLDSVGFTSTPAGLFKEGTGLPTLAASALQYAFYRDTCGKGGSPTTSGPCPTGGFPKDTNNNAADFVFVDTQGTLTAAGQRIGAPGPENLSSPVQRNSTVAVTLLDPGTSNVNPPNRVRDLTSDPPNNSTLGTLLVRRTVTNNTGTSVTRLRFRVVDITTFLAPGGTADLRARSSTGPDVVSITGPNPACPANSCTVQATTVETPPTQSLGGGFNSTVTVTLGGPLPPGGTVNVQFLLGVQQTGNFRYFINIEALP